VPDIAELAAAVLRGDAGEARAGRAAPGGATAAERGSLLEVRGLAVDRGGHRVLFGVDLDVAAGEVLALVGTNGAGKSTLLAAVSGLLRPRAGSVRLGGTDLEGLDAADRVRAGIAQVPGGRAVFPNLSVRDNLLVGCHLFAWDRARVQARLEHVLGIFPQLGGRLDQTSGTLSGGEQQMLGLAKALLLEPRLLLIDELSLGLAPTVVADLLAVVGELRAGGTTMVIVEQSLNLALSIADRAAWLEKGEIRFAGPPADLRSRVDLLGR
jgi:ABC-type branched-subunit amino acid transport system ATPase component